MTSRHVARVALAYSLDWRVRKGRSIRAFSDRLVVQGERAGLLDLSVCLASGGHEGSGRLGLLRPLVAASTSEGIRRDTGIMSSVNCFATRSSESSSVALPSTSIRNALGVEIEVDLLRDKVLHALNWYHAEWERGMSRKLVERIRPTIVWLGRDVGVKLADGRVLKGRATGLDDEGSLLLEQKHRGGRSTSLKIRPESVKLVRAVR
jgi:hypothetical protein